MYADILASEHGSDWGYTEVNLIGGEQQIADLQQQDLLYTVAEMSADAPDRARGWCGEAGAARRG